MYKKDIAFLDELANFIDKNTDYDFDLNKNHIEIFGKTNVYITCHDEDVCFRSRYGEFITTIEHSSKVDLIKLISIIQF